MARRKAEAEDWLQKKALAGARATERSAGQAAADAAAAADAEAAAAASIQKVKLTGLTQNLQVDPAV